MHINILVLTLLILAQSAHGESSAEPTIDQAGISMMASKFWPNHALLTRSVALPSGKQLEEGTRAVLIRIAEDGALLDFGRDGIYTIDIDKTDIYKSIQQAQARPDRMHGLFPSRHINHFFKWDGKDFSNLEIEEISADYYLLAFSDLATENPRQLTHSFNSTTSNLEPNFLRLVICPVNISETDYLDWVKQNDWNGPAMYHYYSKAFRTSFHFPFNDEGVMVVIDANGRIIDSYSPETPIGHVIDRTKTDKERQESFYSTLKLK